VLIGAVDRAQPGFETGARARRERIRFSRRARRPGDFDRRRRDELGHAVALGPDLRDRLARERYYGYIAFTRASEKLVVTFAAATRTAGC